MLDTDCLRWEDNLKQNIASNLLDSLKSVVSVECQDCLIDGASITSGCIVCSAIVIGAAVLRGTIATRHINQTESIFCALNRWQQNRPLVLVGRTFHFVDRDCPVYVESQTECNAPNIIKELTFLIPPILGVMFSLIVLIIPLAVVGVLAWRNQLVR